MAYVSVGSTASMMAAASAAGKTVAAPKNLWAPTQSLFGGTKFAPKAAPATGLQTLIKAPGAPVYAPPSGGSGLSAISKPLLIAGGLGVAAAVYFLVIKKKKAGPAPVAV